MVLERNPTLRERKFRSYIFLELIVVNTAVRRGTGKHQILSLFFALVKGFNYVKYKVIGAARALKGY